MGISLGWFKGCSSPPVTRSSVCPYSYDGVPFLMHDKTLRRTTNVEEMFPERAYELASMFNWTDLEKLNAGEWFLRVGMGPEAIAVG